MNIFFLCLALFHVGFILFECKTSHQEVINMLYKKYGAKEGDVFFFELEKVRISRRYKFFIAVYGYCILYGILQADIVFVFLNLIQVLFTFIDICYITHQLNVLCAGELLDERSHWKRPYNIILNSIYVAWLIYIIIY